MSETEEAQEGLGDFGVDRTLNSRKACFSGRNIKDKRR